MAGDKSTFGRGLMNYVSNALPYSRGFDVIDDVTALNPKFEKFWSTGSRRQEAVSKFAVSTNKGGDEMHPMASIAVDKNYHAFMYANVDYDKSKRLRDYRVMAQYSEVADALDEICDECINQDDKGRIVRLHLQEDMIDSIGETLISNEFDKFIEHYNLHGRGWEYFRQLLVDGELFFEHVIHNERSDLGLLGVISIPSDLVDPIYDNIQNLLVKGFLLRKPVIDQTNAKTAPQAGNNDQKNKVLHIPFDKSQITYIHSGMWNESKSIRLPFIEQARRAYRQLSLIEDSIIIYRLVRAPERLVFNVDVGNMPPPKAEAYLKKLMNNYWSRKTYDVNQGRSVQAFNPQSMLDNFWFAKRAGSEGTNVTSLAGGQNLGELEDLKYFRQKLYRSLRIPVERLNPDTQADSGGSTIVREELKFARFIMRLQHAVAFGLKDAFVAHLKLRGIWDKFEVKEPHIKLQFNPPPNFQELRNQQLLELKWNNYSSAIQNQLVSDTYAKKHYLKLTDDEISTNRELLRKDSELKWELAQIEAMGPNWRELAAAEAGAGAEMAPGGGGGGMPMGGGLGGGGVGAAVPPPEFGPGGTPPEGAEPVAPTPPPAGGGDSALPQ
tara:strand:- start:1829 stop:3655 length:1827 start_codon:yes stop_codon:yes gene_type:complete